MYPHFDIVRPRQRHARRRVLRPATSHLRVLAVLSGKRRVHLASVPVDATEGRLAAFTMQLRERLAKLDAHETTIRVFIERAHDRLSRERDVCAEPTRQHPLRKQGRMFREARGVHDRQDGIAQLAASQCGEKTNEGGTS